MYVLIITDHFGFGTVDEIEKHRTWIGAWISGFIWRLDPLVDTRIERWTSDGKRKVVR